MSHFYRKAKAEGNNTKIYKKGEICLKKKKIICKVSEPHTSKKFFSDHRSQITWVSSTSSGERLASYGTNKKLLQKLGSVYSVPYIHGKNYVTKVESYI